MDRTTCSFLPTLLYHVNSLVLVSRKLAGLPGRCVNSSVHAPKEQAKNMNSIDSVGQSDTQVYYSINII